MNEIKFLPEFIEKIKKGQKNQTRRPLRKMQKNPPKIGDIVSIKGTDANIVITGIREERLCDITVADLHAEGFEYYLELFDAWRGIYGADTPITEVVCVLDFKFAERIVR